MKLLEGTYYTMDEDAILGKEINLKCISEHLNTSVFDFKIKGVTYRVTLEPARSKSGMAVALYNVKNSKELSGQFYAVLYYDRNRIDLTCKGGVSLNGKLANSNYSCHKYL